MRFRFLWSGRRFCASAAHGRGVLPWSSQAPGLLKPPPSALCTVAQVPLRYPKSRTLPNSTLASIPATPTPTVFRSDASIYPKPKTLSPCNPRPEACVGKPWAPELRSQAVCLVADRASNETTLRRRAYGSGFQAWKEGFGGQSRRRVACRELRGTKEHTSGCILYEPQALSPAPQILKL